MNWRLVLAVALGVTAMAPSPGMAHLEHDLSEKPELTEVNPAEDWVGAFKGISPVSNVKISVPIFRGFLFPTAFISGSPSQQIASGTETTLRFLQVSEQSISGTFVGGSAPQDTKIVAPRDGLYEFVVTLDSSGVETWRSYILIKKYASNGTFIENCGKDDRADPDSTRSLASRGLVQMQKGQYLTVRFWHNKGTSYDGPGGCRVFIQRVAPLPAP